MFLFLICSNLKISFLCIIGLFIGTMLPDIDIKESKINNLLIVTKPLSCFFHHRGFTHSFICLFIISYVLCTTDVFFNLNGFSIGFFIGYASHLIADMFTPKGIQLLWPLPYHIRIPFLNRNEKNSKLFLSLFFILISLKYLF